MKSISVFLASLILAASTVLAGNPLNELHIHATIVTKEMENKKIEGDGIRIFDFTYSHALKDLNRPYCRIIEVYMGNLECNKSKDKDSALYITRPSIIDNIEGDGRFLQCKIIAENDSEWVVRFDEPSPDSNRWHQLSIFKKQHFSKSKIGKYEGKWIHNSQILKRIMHIDFVRVTDGTNNSYGDLPINCNKFSIAQ